jgi:hypothetical protein
VSDDGSIRVRVILRFVTHSFQACIPSASGCRDTFETLSSAVLRRLSEEDSSFMLNPQQSEQSSGAVSPSILASLPAAAISVLPDDLYALDSLLTNPLPAPANTYDVGSNLPTAELDILPELSDIFGATAADVDRHNQLYAGMALPL